ncbi:hypothetical protein BDK51DRAFT_38162 [Blyttiomyces helicus]|uniref:Uncharacterized protein n=1 Tax=Blyttiomyces helicus TaxID=388810 RepID=A0A4P9VYW3_9FUNG|nr:hypothetical protein BDK51DRAFT_38162 [Blyttiomyces helicus]|eukprot:RKO84165.1 hypothetical protein BDK51DRAFT_38162 [Blyttiomyces helicus]
MAPFPSNLLTHSSPFPSYRPNPTSRSRRHHLDPPQIPFSLFCAPPQVTSSIIPFPPHPPPQSATPSYVSYVLGANDARSSAEVVRDVVCAICRVLDEVDRDTEEVVMRQFGSWGVTAPERHHHWSSPIVRFRDVGVREKKRVGVRRAGAAAPVCDDLAASAGASGDLRKGRYRTGFVEGPGGGAGSGSAFLSTPRLPTSANIPCTRITRGARTSISNGSTPPAPSSPLPSSASWAPQTGPPSHRPPLEASSLQTFDKCVTCLM